MSDTAADPASQYERFERSGGATILERDVIEVTGPDAGRYLQGQLSQDVVAMVGDSAWSLLLQPSGKVDAWVRVHRRSDEDYVVDVDAGWGEVVRTRLTRFLLRTKAEVGEPRRRRVLLRRRPAVASVLGDAPAASPDDWLVSPAVGPGVGGSDALVLTDEGNVGVTLDVLLVEPEIYERYRIAHGIPAMGAELTEDTIPAEAGQWLIDASVSFTKGCYTGQELVARIDSRGGNVPRPVRLLVFDAGSVVDLAVGAEVVHDGAAVGTITSVTPSLSPDLPALALAPVKRSVEVGSRVEVASAGARLGAVIAEPPFTG